MADHGTDLLKYIAAKAAALIDAPRKTGRRGGGPSREAWRSRWFGMVPLALSIWMKSRRGKKKKRKKGRSADLTEKSPRTSPPD